MNCGAWVAGFSGFVYRAAHHTCGDCSIPGLSGVHVLSGMGHNSPQRT